VPTSPTGTHEPIRTIKIVDPDKAKEMLNAVFANDLCLAFLLEHGALSLHVPTMQAAAEEDIRRRVRVAIRGERVVFVLDDPAWMVAAHNALGECMEAWLEPVQDDDA
jgi:hypothetical protein